MISRVLFFFRVAVAYLIGPALIRTAKDQLIRHSEVAVEWRMAFDRNISDIKSLEWQKKLNKKDNDDK